MLDEVLEVILKVLAYSFVLLTASWVWFQWSHRDLIRAAANLPCVFRKFPILGHAPYTFFGIENATRYVIQGITQTAATGVNTMCFWCGPLPLIIIQGLEDVQKVLNSTITSEKGDEMQYVYYALRRGLLCAPGNIWKVTRRHINHLFHPRNVEQLIPTFNQNSRELVIVLSEHVGHGPVNVMDHTMDVALKTICNLIFGPYFKLDMKSEGFRGLKTAVELKELKEINDIWRKFTETPLKITKENNELKDYKNGLQDENGPDAIFNSKKEVPLNLIDVYSVLQKNYTEFTDEDLQSEMLTLFCTGSDTVGLAVASSMLILAQYQNIQDTLFKEISSGVDLEEEVTQVDLNRITYCDQVYKETLRWSKILPYILETLFTEISSVVGLEEDVTQDHLNRMPYLDQVYKETLRWSTIVPFIIRKPSEDIKLSSCTIPAGSTLAVCLAGVHMNPKSYANPQQFDPEHFSPESIKTRERYAFIPFSGGPRNCIGKTYSQLLVKTMLVHVLRRFKLSTTMDIHTMRRKLVVTLVSVEGYNVTLEDRLKTERST